MSDEKLVDKLKKIKAMADGAKDVGNEAEAQAFAAMLQKLLAKHNLDMSDVEWEQQKEEKATVEMWSRPDGKGKVGQWAFQLASVIGKANQCRVLIFGRGMGIQFIGSSGAVEVCKQTMDYMYVAAKKLANDALRERKKQGGFYSLENYRSSFLDGFIHRLRARFDAEAAKVAKQYQSTALVRIGHSLKLADAYLSTVRVGTLRTARRRSNVVGFSDGVAKANSVNIGGQKLAENSLKKTNLLQ